MGIHATQYDAHRFALTLIGCKGKEIVTESVRTEYVDRYIHDTIRVDNLTQILDSVRESVIESRRDCVVIVKDTAGNVINTAQWHYRDTNKELSHSKEKVDSTAYFRSVIDSLRRIKQDSIYIKKGGRKGTIFVGQDKDKVRRLGILHRSRYHHIPYVVHKAQGQTEYLVVGQIVSLLSFYLFIELVFPSCS